MRKSFCVGNVVVGDANLGFMAAAMAAIAWTCQFTRFICEICGESSTCGAPNVENIAVVAVENGWFL
jgi:hypothetical protein